MSFLYIPVSRGSNGVDTFVGIGALSKITTGVENSAFGYAALANATAASSNVAVGNSALYTNDSGDANIAIGVSSLFSNLVGSRNIAVGGQALQDNFSGTYNIAVGQSAMRRNSSNSLSVAIGTESLYESVANDNTAVGTLAGRFATNGGKNTFLGSRSGYLITTGAANTVVGRFDGNQFGLDIRTASNYIVLSDGDGNPRLWSDNTGAINIPGGIVFPSGTPNGVLFLNGSGAVSSGTALTWDGTTFATTGNVTLGDASTDTVRINGYMGVGGAATIGRAIDVKTSALTGATNALGVNVNVGIASDVTNTFSAIRTLPATAAAPFTVGQVTGLNVSNPTKGAGSTISFAIGIDIADHNVGTNNIAIQSQVSSGSNKWNIYASGTAANYFAGDVLVGTASARSTFFGSTTPKVQFEGTVASLSRIVSITSNGSAAAGSPPALVFGKTRGTVVGGTTAVVANDFLFSIAATGSDGTNLAQAAGIEAYADGTVSAGVVPGRLVFSTTNTSGTLTERLRIDSSGALIAKPAAGTGAVFNEDGVDADFRVESDTNTHALFVNAGNSRIGVNESNPDTALSVNGVIQATGDYSVTSIANGATASVITPNRGFSYVNISRSDTASFGLMLLVFRTTSTLEIVSTVSDKTSASYSASVSGTAIQITNSSGATMSFYASAVCIAFGTGD